MIASVHSEKTRLKKMIMIIGERSEPLSRVFNDQPRDNMVVSVRTYVSNKHADVRIRVCYKIGTFADCTLFIVSLI